jgi:hypothetical protein
MKKLQKTFPVLMAVCVLSMLGFSGCQMFPGNQQAPQGNVDATPLERRIGVIQSLGGVKTSSQGTDLLLMDDGSTMLLKSLAFNLDDAQYVGKKVEVSGVITFTTDQKQLMEVENIDVLQDVPVTQQQPQQSATWTDYVNAGLGFQVKYRNDFTVAENGQAVTFTRAVSPDAFMMNGANTQEASLSTEVALNHVITVSAQPHTSTESLITDFLKLSDDKDSTLNQAGYSRSLIGSGSIQSFKHVSSDGKNVAFYFDDGTNFFQVNYMGGGDSQNVEDQSVFYEFLSYFQLLNGASGTQQFVQPVPSTVPTTAASNSNSNSAVAGTAVNSGSAAAGTSTTSTSDTSTSDTTGTPDETSAAAINNVNTLPRLPVAAPATTEQNSGSVTAATVPVSDSSVSNTTAAATSPDSTGTTQQALPGYVPFSSTAYKFTLQIPKSWYYGQSTSTDASVVRHYDFGPKPLDQQPAIAGLDVMSGPLPSGSTASLNNKSVVVVQNGDNVSYYYQDSSGRVYRVTGPSADANYLQTMIGTIDHQ